MLKAKITRKMIEFYNGSMHDIEHFLKVNAYASTIGKLEGLNEKDQLILEIASIVHDIACPLCREKYGKASGNLQEIESENLLRPFLEEFNLESEILERVIYLVSHHHTYENVDGLDYQILLEADYLVNAYEGNQTKESIEAFVDKVVKTSIARSLFKSMYSL